jgi:Cu-Zn family superoxide dismutase
MKAIWISILAAALPGASTAAAPATSASARIARPDNVVVGQATLTQTRGGVAVSVRASGLSPGRFGIHIHQTGRCDAPDFASAGGHWNPSSRHHGRLNPEGPHLGDLPNLELNAAGTGALRFVIAGARLQGGDHPVLDADGASIVLHAATDDYRTDPSGNSGARAACGVIG